MRLSTPRSWCSALASKEIKSLIDLSVNEVKTGSDLVKESGETLNHIIESANIVADLIEKIAFASQNQSDSITELSQAIIDMDQTTQQNAALVEENTASAQSMRDQASALLKLTEFFKAV